MRTSPYAARLRAARAYANLNREPVAEALGVSLRTLSRLEAGELPSSVEQRRVVAGVCGVPEWFLEHGFEGATLDGAQPTLRDEVEAVRHELVTLRGQQRELRETRERLEVVEEDLSAVLQMAAAWPTAAPPGVQPTEPPASRSNETNRRPSPRREGQASEPGTEQ